MFIWSSLLTTDFRKHCIFEHLWHLYCFVKIYVSLIWLPLVLKTSKLISEIFVGIRSSNISGFFSFSCRCLQTLWWFRSTVGFSAEASSWCGFSTSVFWSRNFDSLWSPSLVVRTWHHPHLVCQFDCRSLKQSELSLQFVWKKCSSPLWWWKWLELPFFIDFW